MFGKPTFVPARVRAENAGAPLLLLALVRGDRAVYGILVRELVRRGQSVGAERLPRDDPEALDEGRDHLLGAVRAACVC